MPFPAVQGSNSGTNGATTTHTINLPSGIVAGELLLAFVITSGGDGNHTMSGWTRQVNQGGAAAGQLMCFYRVADGSEGASATMTTNNSQTSAYFTWRVNGQRTSSFIESASTSGGGSKADPPNLAPSWGADDVQWWALMANDGDNDVTGYPASYADWQVWTQKPSPIDTLGAASRALNAASDNPGAFNHQFNSDWAAATVAIRGAPEVAIAAYVPGRRVPKRLSGPAQLSTSAATIYTAPVDMRAMLRSVHVSNPSGSPVTFTLSVGADAAGTRIIDAYSVPAGAFKRWFFQIWMNPSEVLQAKAGTGSVLVCTINGFERPAG